MRDRLDMTNARPVNGRSGARQIIFAQFLMTLLVALAFAGFSGLADAYAALAGGLINVAANLYFARKLYGGKKDAARVIPTAEMISKLFVGEFVKLFIIVALLALAIGVLKLAFLPLLAGFVATLSVFRFALSPTFGRIMSGKFLHGVGI